MDSDTGGLAVNGIHVIPDFIDSEALREIKPLLINALENWRDGLKSQTNPILSVIKQENKMYGNNIIKLRNSENSSNTKLHQVVRNHIYKDKTSIEAIFSELESEEEFNITVMLDGSSVPSHTDKQVFPQGLRSSNKMVLRDITSVCYLNDDFDGGELSFDLLGTKIKPKAGMLVFFPTPNIYQHSVSTVSNGQRYSVSKFWNFRSS